MKSKFIIENNNVPTGIDLLTSRERQIMRKVLAGKLNKQIAAELDLQVYQIENSKHSIKRKFHAHTMEQVIYYLWQKNLLDSLVNININCCQVLKSVVESKEKM